MIPLGLGAKILGFFGGVPRWVYIALAVAALIGGGLYAHHRAVKSAYDAAFKAGGEAEAARAKEANRKLAVKQAAITAPIRKANDETNTRIAGDADDLLLRGPGKAAVHCPAPAAARQPQPPAQPASAAAAPMPAEDGATAFVAVPWGWLVGTGKQCDLELAENVAWRSWFARQSAAEQAARLQPKE